MKFHKTVLLSRSLNKHIIKFSCHFIKKTLTLIVPSREVFVIITKNYNCFAKLLKINCLCGKLRPLKLEVAIMTSRLEVAAKCRLIKLMMITLGRGAGRGERAAGRGARSSEDA